MKGSAEVRGFPGRMDVSFFYHDWPVWDFDGLVFHILVVGATVELRGVNGGWSD